MNASKYVRATVRTVSTSPTPVTLFGSLQHNTTQLNSPDSIQFENYDFDTSAKLASLVDHFLSEA